MILKVIRDTSTDQFTLGEFVAYVDGAAVAHGHTVERPWKDNKPYVSCIPTGTYKAFKRVSEKNGNVIELKDVPGRTNIQFHIANWAHELEGCIAPGMDRMKDGVKDSAEAMEQLNDLAEGDITVEIVDISDVPKFRNDRAEWGIIDPADMPEFTPEIPVEYTETVSYSNTLAEFKSSLRERFQRREKARFFFNAVVSFVSKRLGVPELQMLKLNQTRNNMSDIDISKKIQKIISADGWEAIVWLAVAVLALAASLLTGNYELIAGAGAAGIKAGFQWYKAQESSEG